MNHEDYAIKLKETGKVTFTTRPQNGAQFNVIIAKWRAGDEDYKVIIKKPIGQPIDITDIDYINLAGLRDAIVASQQIIEATNNLKNK
jgi:hypothetical protein